MTVLSTTSSQRFHGSGSTGPFTFSWRFLANTDLKIYRIAEPNETDVSLEDPVLLTEGDDYTLTGAGSYTGGSLTLVAALADGEDLVIKRQTATLQKTDIRNQGNNFYPEVHEDAFDAQVMMIQDRDREVSGNAEEISGIKPRLAAAEVDVLGHGVRLGEAEAGLSRSLKFPAEDAADPTLPALADRASKYLWFDSTGALQIIEGEGLPSVPVSTTPLPGAAAQYDAAGGLAAETLTFTDVRGPVVHRVATIADLHLISGSSGRQAVQVMEAGRGGLFKWDGSNLSVQVAADTQSGIYVAPAAAPTGASGAWVRQYSGDQVNVKWFGAKGDWNEVAKTGTDDRTAIIAAAAFAAANNIRDVVFPTAAYRTQFYPVRIHSNQRWLLNGSTIRRYGVRENGLGSNVIESQGFTTATNITNAAILGGIIWGDGEEHGKATNSNQVAGIALFGSGCVIENVTSKYSGGDTIGLYGLVGGEANTLRNVVAGPGWGQNAISIVTGTVIWDNVEVRGVKYAGANPGLDIAIENDVSGQSSRHFMTGVRAKDITFADLHSSAGANFSHEVWMDNCEFGPSFAPLSFISTNATTAKNVHVGSSVKAYTGASADSRAFYLKNVHNVKLNGPTLDTTASAVNTYGILIIGEVAGLTSIGTIFPDTRTGAFTVLNDDNTLRDSTFVGSNLRSLLLGNASYGNTFKACTINNLELRGVATTDNYFDEATTIASVTKGTGGHLSGQRIRNRRGSVVATYDVAVNGGATGDMFLGERLPVNSRVTKASYEVIVQPVAASGSPQIAFGTYSQGEGIKAFTAVSHSSFNVGVHDGIPTGAATTFGSKNTQPRGIYINISGGTLSAGRIVVFADYVVTDN